MTLQHSCFGSRPICSFLRDCKPSSTKERGQIFTGADVILSSVNGGFGDESSVAVDERFQTSLACESLNCV